MTSDVPILSGLDGFLAKHGPVAGPKFCRAGSVWGGWRVTEFLGRGGNAEVCRVVPLAGDAADAAALKVLLKDDAASRARFAREIKILSASLSPFLPKLLDSGEVGGRPYLVTELLEPADLPTSDAAVADYLLAICKAVSALHHAGIVHRDVKPSNVMRRANGDVVLIDLGLAKDVEKSPEPECDVSVVSGSPVGVGTPRYAAPEQMLGGAVTAAADVHAIGRLADMAFGSDPPRCWLPIIRRATSSIPGRRYSSVEALARAIRRRNDRRRAALVAAVLGLTVLVAGVSVGLWRTAIAPAVAWRALCENVSTNLVVEELVWERLVTNKVGNSTLVSPERASRQVQKPVEATFVRLNGRTNAFDRPIVLDSSREYFVEGPGILAADVQAKDGIVRLHLKNCFLFNRSPISIDKANVRYVFEGGAYLNFTEQDKPPNGVVGGCIEGFDGASDEICFKGPTDKEQVERMHGVQGLRILEREWESD